MQSIDWLALVGEIQSAISECARSGSFDRQAYSSAWAVISPDGGSASPIKSVQLNRFDDSTPSFLAVNGVDSSQVTGATFWALFIAAEGAGQKPLAWESLERAHAMQRAARGRKVSREQAEVQYQQIKMIFHKGFWTDLITPKIRTKSSKLPIFIVGMMRCFSAQRSILCEILMVGFEILLGQVRLC